jgi:DNA-binding NarL/FixJ family response regulator
MRKTRVLIADDHAVLRAGLRMLINAQPDLEVVGEAADCPEALRKARELSPDVLTLDLSMPGGGSVKVIERLREECPPTRVLVLTMHDDPAYLRAVLAVGGSGYVVKTAADTELLTAIRAVARGRTFIDLDLAANKGQEMFGNAQGSHPARATAPAPALSPREREVLQLLAQGHTNQFIADRLFLSIKTIETYRARIADKLGLRSRADIIRYAIEIGLIGPGKHGGEDHVL